MADDMVTARVHPSTKKKLVASGYTGRQAIEYFVRDYYSANPRKRIEVKKQILANDIEELKRQECEVQLEIEHKEALLDKLTVGEVTGADDVDEQEPLVYDLPADVQRGVNIVQKVLSRKRGLYGSSVESAEEGLTRFIEENREFVVSTFDDYASGLSWEEFRGILLSELVI